MSSLISVVRIFHKVIKLWGLKRVSILIVQCALVQIVFGFKGDCIVDFKTPASVGQEIGVGKKLATFQKPLI
jgi:hypothetical protein